MASYVTKMKVGSTTYQVKDAAAQATLAPKYDGTAMYKVGDYVRYGSQLYVCTAEIPAGGEAWDEANWSQVKVGEAVAQAARHAAAVGSVNLWDENWINANIVDATGAVTSSGSFVVSRNPIPVEPGATYYIHCGNSAGGLFVYGYEDFACSKFVVKLNNPGTIAIKNQTWTIPEGVRYLKFRTGGSYTGAYQFDISFNCPETETGYHPHSAESLRRRTAEAIADLRKADADLARMGGINLWDEVFETGAFNNTTGEPAATALCMRSANFIPVTGGEAVYFHMGSSGSVRAYFYDSEKAFIEYVDGVQNKAITVPATAAYMKFRTANYSMENGAFSGEYLHDISINCPAAFTGYYRYGQAAVKAELGALIADRLPEAWVDAADAFNQKLQTERPCDFRLLIFTDPHGENEIGYRLIRKTMDGGCFDALAGLGDNTAWTLHNTDEQAYGINRRMLSIAGRDANCLYAPGNHDIAYFDTNSGGLDIAKTMTPRQAHDVFCRHLNGTACFDAQNPYGCYYYVDYEAAKIRVIVLNTSDIFEPDGALEHKYLHSVMFHERQLQWLASEACMLGKGADTPNWSILVLQHAEILDVNGNSPVERILDKARSGSSQYANGRTFTFRRRNAFDGEAYTTDASDEEDAVTVTVDYSAQGEVNVIGVLCGHAHIEMARSKGGMASICFGADNPAVMDLYGVEIEGLEVGAHTAACQSALYGFESTNAQIGARRLVMNVRESSKMIRAYDADGNYLGGCSAAKLEGEVGEFELQSLRDGTVGTENLYAVSVDKGARKVYVDALGMNWSSATAYQ